LPRHKADPSRKIASRSEGPWITNTGDQSGGEGWTDARDIVKPLTDRVRSVPSHDLAVEREDLDLQHLKLGAKGGNAPTRHIGQSLVIQISGNIEQLFNTMTPYRCNDPKFSEMAADRIDHRSLLANEQVAGAVEHQAALLFRRLGTAK
jgi:hypothetical protein